MKIYTLNYFPSSPCRCKLFQGTPSEASAGSAKSFRFSGAQQVIQWCKWQQDESPPLFPRCTRALHRSPLTASRGPSLETYLVSPRLFSAKTALVFQAISSAPTRSTLFLLLHHQHDATTANKKNHQQASNNIIKEPCTFSGLSLHTCPGATESARPFRPQASFAHALTPATARDHLQSLRQLCLAGAAPFPASLAFAICAQDCIPSSKIQSPWRACNFPRSSPI